MPDSDLESVRVRRPHPALVSYVGAYVGYLHHTDPASVHFGLPSLGCTVIIALDEPLDVGWYGSRASRGTHWLLASGLHTGPALIHTNGLQHGIQLDLTPDGVRALLGCPAGALAGELVDHADVPLGIDAVTHAQIAAAGSWAERFDALEAHLLRIVDTDAVRTRPEVSHAWRLLSGAGDVSVERAADEVGWSRRHLTDQFTAEYGLRPKETARIARFGRARALAESGTSLAVVAAEAGYADQAHLTREWHRLAGRPPATALHEDFPIVQDLAAG